MRPYTVVALLVWFKVSGIRSGPIFPALNKARTALNFGCYNTAGCYSGWIREFFIYVGGDMAKCRSHSIRKSAVKWGVR